MLYHTAAFLLTALAVNALPVEVDLNAAVDATWDVIIVGAGPAGIVVADRMSEAGKKTLLLEQGGPSYYITGGRSRPAWLDNQQLSRVDVPGLYRSIFANGAGLICPSNLTSAYHGCSIGGSTSINGGLFIQPPASDWDKYFPAQWHSQGVSGAVAKVRAKQPFTNNPSKDGKRYLQTGYDATKKWLVGNAGFDNFDLNAQPNNRTRAFGRTYFSYEGGQRSGAVKTYLQSALSRTNFHLISGVRVKRVARSGSQATGVDAVFNNGTTTTFKLAPKGRVVSSGGAIFSPQILMLSGIGPADQLTNLKTNGLLTLSSSSWINNTAVGDGLFDNPNTFLELSGPSIQAYYYSYNSPIPADRDLYLNSRSGPYSFAGETAAFWQSVSYLDGSLINVQGTVDCVGNGAFTGSDTITVNIYATSGAKSTSRVVLNGKGVPGPADDFLYKNPLDADAIARVIQGIFAHLPGTGLTPRNIKATATKDEIQQYITTPSTLTRGYVNHWSSSCRLGSCVDLNTKVKGMNNLFVVDASIVSPFTTNPAFGIMIAAERASELILALPS